MHQRLFSLATIIPFVHDRLSTGGPLARPLAPTHRIQRPDGSWEGMWGICFTYGIWFAIDGLVEAGLSGDHPAILKACEFLISKQKVRDDLGIEWS